MAGAIKLFTQALCCCRWDKNWIIHLDGVFQTADRLGDHHVHVARGMRRLTIVDTMPEVEEGFIGAPPAPALMCTVLSTTQRVC